MRKANFVENVRELTIAVLTGTTDIEGYNKYIASKNVSVAYFTFVFCFFFAFLLLFALYANHSLYYGLKTKYFAIDISFC